MHGPYGRIKLSNDILREPMHKAGRGDMAFPSLLHDTVIPLGITKAVDGCLPWESFLSHKNTVPRRGFDV